MLIIACLLFCFSDFDQWSHYADVRVNSVLVMQHVFGRA